MTSQTMSSGRHQEKDVFISGSQTKFGQIFPNSPNLNDFYYGGYYDDPLPILKPFI